MSPRMQQIMLVLLQEEEPVAVAKLAERIGVSKRTLQRELADADRALKDTSLQFASKTGLGVWVQGAKEEKQALWEELSQKDTYDTMNREERRKRLMLEILKDRGLKKIFYYSNLFDVSESTISSDLRVVEKWLAGYNLQVIRKPGSGVEILGKERDYRRAIRVFIDENLDTQIIRDSYDREEFVEQKLQTIRNNMIHEVLSEDVLSRVIHCIAGMNDKRVLDLTESSYVGLVLHISIALNRILKEAVIEENETKVLDMEREDEDYALAERMVEELEEEFEIDIPKREISYICLHIKGAKHTNIPLEQGRTVAKAQKEMLQLVNDLIDEFDGEIAFELKQDEEFIQGLLAHLQPTFVRLKNQMKIVNPVLDEIKRDYKELFVRCKEAAKVLEKYLEMPVPEAEIGFLTMHFGAAMVRLEGKKESLRRVDIGVVCASGIGISRMMLSKIENHFKDRVRLVTYGKKDITPYIVSRTDFFVTSIPLDLPGAVIVSVNPLLSIQDMEAVSKQVFHFERLPREKGEENDFALELEQINLLAMQIKTVLSYLAFHEVEEEISLAELLVRIGDSMSPYADRSYKIQEDLWRRERLGTQIFAEFGFAMLHTRTEGVVRPCVSVWRTTSGDAFTNPSLKGIQFVLVMLIPQDENCRVNTEIMGHISSSLIEEFERLEVLRNGTKEEIQTMLSDCLRKFFAKKLSLTEREQGT